MLEKLETQMGTKSDKIRWNHWAVLFFHTGVGYGFSALPNSWGHGLLHLINSPMNISLTPTDSCLKWCYLGRDAESTGCSLGTQGMCDISPENTAWDSLTLRTHCPKNASWAAALDQALILLNATHSWNFCPSRKNSKVELEDYSYDL